MKRWKKIALGALLVLVAMQLVILERTNPPVTADIRVAPDVKAVLKRACYDCHSNETVWPWYSRIAPASWTVQWDVRTGRKHLNFSDWESMPPEKRAKKQRKVGKEVTEGEMPLSYYTPLHREAVLSSADKQLIQTWAKSAGPAPAGGDD